ncbi:MAG: heavy metal translocating P-type ATPase, partial [Sphingobacteriales bacterium]
MANECCDTNVGDQPVKPVTKKEHTHNHDHGHADGHDHDHDHGENEAGWKTQLPLLTALAILIVMLVLEFGFHHVPAFPVNLVIFAAAYLLAGYGVLRLAFRKALRLDFFNEFFLMSVATIGAFAIGSYSEGVAVMVFYSIGEWFQDSAVDRATASIKALLDIRPDEVTVIRDGKAQVIPSADVKLGEIIQVNAGEKVALDGKLVSDKGSFNTAALTGESRP